MSEEIKFVTVKASDVTKVALFEQHADHPGGEAYVAGDNATKVALTPTVIQKIRDGVLVDVSETPQEDIEPIKPVEPKSFAPVKSEVTEFPARKGK